MMRPARPGHCESQKSSLRRLMMEWFSILMARLRVLFRRESVLRDIEEELRVHIEMETETNIKRGMAPDEARVRALKSFGDVCRNTELGYDIRGGGWLETLWQDLRYGVRILLKNPGCTLVVILTMALGIGANTAIFTLVNAVFLQPLPVAEPARLMSVFGTDEKNCSAQTDYIPMSWPNFKDYRDLNDVFTGMIAFQNIVLNFS